jgi:hypothetical protein
MQGGNLMLEKIEAKEIMTSFEAHEKYNTKFFIMIFTEVVDQGDNDLGYVIYTADSDRELNEVPRSEYIGKPAGFMMGGMAYPYPLTGKVVY